MVDLALAAALVYFSVWVYELANLLALSLSGGRAVISYGVLLPVGTTMLSSSPALSPGWKLLQVSLCCAFGLGALVATRRWRLAGSQLVSVCLLSVFLGSIWWEMLGGSAPLSSGGHLSVFVGLSAGIELLLFMALGRPSARLSPPNGTRRRSA